MPAVGGRQPVLMVFRIVVASSARTVRRSAITELMNVEGVFLTGSQPFDVRHDLHRVAFLSEAHGAVTIVAGSRVQHGDGLFDGRPAFAVIVFRRAQRGS